MSANGTITFLVTFDRIGRLHNVAPLNVTVDDGPADAVAEELLEAVYTYARPMCASRFIDVSLKSPEIEEARPLVSADLDGVAGFISAGMQSAGRFTVVIERTETDSLTQKLIDGINSNPLARRAFARLADAEAVLSR